MNIVLQIGEKFMDPRNISKLNENEKKSISTFCQQVLRNIDAEEEIFPFEDFEAVVGEKAFLPRLQVLSS